ncbi:hypothetical protein M422DRAFT_29315 [Sphaerobolus stellatus SS14]|uniref:Uncharacterized protein n=1 Tax=Sphaerobolus stellatus (strain SS14) TaxID=990650 RepID=A0A0C9UEP7_SPHS4|nr:hypothetical protein M422DRAFT_39386 [Sphaerobolus stellatus SS14]KIJ46482.1 hypothetical protein M422DRAFT_29315 [Sphaerobolus stellatus SS14]
MLCEWQNPRTSHLSLFYYLCILQHRLQPIPPRSTTISKPIRDHSKDFLKIADRDQTGSPP